MSFYLIIKCYIYLIASIISILILRKYFGSNNFFNKVTNLLLYMLEFFSFGVVFNLIFDKTNFQMNKDILLVVKDFVFSNTIYQIILNMILKFWDGTTIDSYNSITVYIKKCLLLSEDEEQLSAFIKHSEKDFNFLNRIGSYNNYGKNVLSKVNLINTSFFNGKISQEDYKNQMEYERVELENELSITSFGWQSSILLRWLK